VYVCVVVKAIPMIAIWQSIRPVKTGFNDCCKALLLLMVDMVNIVNEILLLSWLLMSLVLEIIKLIDKTGATCGRKNYFCAKEEKSE
jgi:hypothetical protein